MLSTIRSTTAPESTPFCAGDLCERAAVAQPVGQGVDLDADEISHLLCRLLSPLLASFAAGPLRSTFVHERRDPLQGLGPLLVRLVGVDAPVLDGHVDPLVRVRNHQVDDRTRVDAVLGGDLGQRAAVSQPVTEGIHLDADEVGDLLHRFLSGFTPGFTTVLASRRLIGGIIDGRVVGLRIDDATDLGGTEQGAAGERGAQQAGPDALVREVLHDDCSLFVRKFGG